MSLEKIFKHIEKEGKIELTDSFKSVLTETVDVAIAGEKAKVDAIQKKADELITENEALHEQLEALKEDTLAEVQKEVEAYKEQLVEKISAYLDVELEKMIPDEVVEAIAKLEIYEPIVEGFKETMGRYGIEVDSEGHELLKEAKNEIEKLRDAFDEATEKAIDLTNEMEKINATVTLMEKCNGLTEDQKKKMVVIFKGKSTDEINERFDEVRDMIIESTTKKDDTKLDKKDNKTVVKETVDTDKLINEEEQEDLGQRLL
jgi:uncharacterized coiled-coil DUF342 family protein